MKKYFLAILMVIIALFQFETSNFVLGAEDADLGKETGVSDEVNSDTSDEHESEGQDKSNISNDKLLKESDTEEIPQKVIDEESNETKEELVKEKKDNKTKNQSTNDEESSNNIQTTSVPDKYTIGDNGDHVIKLKEDLTRLGFGKFPSNPSAAYGKVTAGVVKKFQSYYDLPDTGDADEATLNKIQEVLNPPYKNRDRGEPIVEIKQKLTKLGFGNFPSNPSIYYGTVTANVVRDFQKAFGLEESGEADQTTLNKMDELLSSGYQIGTSGEHVRELKNQLTELGFGNFPSNPSTAYGTVTAGVVEEFQSYYGLPVTGLADEVTRNKIKEILNPPYINGDRGKPVVELKKDLTKLGFGNFPSNPSIYYGTVTANVVKDFQKAFGLEESEEADQTTLNKMDEILNSDYRIGISGKHVRELKVQLTELGFGNFPSNPSTAYGTVTAGVVEDFQSYYGLPVTGIADEVTRSKIKEILELPYKSGDRGQAVVKLKNNLTKIGFGSFPSNPSIFYGSVTAKTVKEFQRFYGLDADGVAGKETLQKIEDIITNPYKNGASGTHVIKLKKNLTRIGFGSFPAEPSGAYGAVTSRVVKEFQVYFGLSNQSGEANNETIQEINKVLNSPYQSGKSGDHIVKLKKDLTLLGFGKFPSTPSKVYGSVTEGVVKDFQKAYNLKVNGIADEITLAKIEELVKKANQKPKPKTDYTNYKLTLNEALDIQINRPIVTTDKYRNDPAYVSAKYLRLIGSGKISGSKINIRTSASTSSKIAYTFAGGTPINITKSVNGSSYSGSTLWYEIAYNGKRYYVHSSLATGSQAEATGTVNVRAGKGTSYHIYGQLKKGDRVTIVNPGSNWHEISYSAWRKPTRADVKDYLDPSKVDKFQHLRLDSIAGATTSELNKILSGKGILNGQGQAFINGANKHNVNEAYLVAHALLETGNGSSTLATGVKYNGKTVYNMFGIGAVDSNPINAGAKTAYENGWFTPEAAIEGGAAWIADPKEGYIYNEHNQDTLYKMKWNPRMSEGYAWKQYATDIAWAEKQTKRIKDIYEQLDNPSYHFDIPQYK